MRHCQFCGTEITECNGFVNAGDFVKALAGDIAWTDVREFCGRCDVKMGLEEMRRVYGEALLPHHGAGL